MAFLAKLAQFSQLFLVSPFYLSVSLSLCPSVSLSLCPSVPLSPCPSVPCPSVPLSLRLCPSVLLSLCLSVRLSLCPVSPSEQNTHKFYRTSSCWAHCRAHKLHNPKATSSEARVPQTVYIALASSLLFFFSVFQSSFASLSSSILAAPPRYNRLEWWMKWRHFQTYEKHSIKTTPACDKAFKGLQRPPVWPQNRSGTPLWFTYWFQTRCRYTYRSVWEIRLS